MLRIYSQSLGCPKTRVDTERLLGSLGPVVTVNLPEQADLVFINTCAFIAPAVQESVQAVVEMIEDIGSLPREKRPFLAVAGCLPGRYGIADLAAELPEVDLWLHTDDIDTWAAQLSHALGLNAPAPGRLLSTGPSYAWLKIGEGCRHNCSFCAIPSIRGKYASEEADKLVTEASALVADGVKELILVAQDVTAYGTDFGKDPRFLLEKLLSLDGLRRLRLLYLYPAGLTRDLLRFLKEAGDPFVPYFDMPLQHVNDDLLRAMHRRGSQAHIRRVLEHVAAHAPDFILRTTMMVGFPGETDAQFQELLAFLRDHPFDRVGAFAFSPEEGTEAAAMPRQIPEDVKQARLDALMSQQRGISRARGRRRIGQTVEVLIEGADAHGAFGRSYAEAPDVDGRILLPGAAAQAGTYRLARLTAANDYDMIGELL